MSASNYGKLFLILSFANLAGGLLCKYLIKRFVSIFKIKTVGLVLSSVGCTLLLCGTLLISGNSSIFLASVMIFVPMAIHLMGHALIVPMLLRNALEDYAKVTGAAGSIFGFLYYMITAIVSFMISVFHSDTINNYAYLFAVMLIACLVLFYLTFQWKQKAIKPEFN
jgi:MFS transporter, DHA1 family, multidrug resistance protein